MTDEEIRSHVGLGVYRLRSRSGALLYVGVSDNVARRLMQHKVQPWWWQVASVTVEPFGDREKADRAERAAIATECPTFNRRGTVEGSTPRDRAFDAWHDAISAVRMSDDPITRADAQTSEYDLRACVELAEGHHPSKLTRNGFVSHEWAGNEGRTRSDEGSGRALVNLMNLLRDAEAVA